MAQHISPGVYTKIIDLSEFLADIPGTLGFIPVLSKRGPDNQLVYIGNNKDFRTLFGNPNITQFGQAYGQGMYIAQNHLSIASSIYITRALPDDATYANIFLALQIMDPNYHSSSSDYVAEPAHCEVAAVSFPNMNSVAELNTRLQQPVISEWVNVDITGGTGLGDGFLCYFYPVGRGDSYNDFSIKMTKYVNPRQPGVYTLEIYERQASSGDIVLSESFTVSFDKTALDDSGESMFIEDVVNKFSVQIRCVVNNNALQVLDEQQYEFHLNEEEDTYPDNPYYITDPTDPDYGRLGYKEWIKQEKKAVYVVAQANLNVALAALTAARAMPQTSAAEVEARNLAITSATIQVALARSALDTAKQEYEDSLLLDILTVKDSNPATPTVDPVPFANGSDGSLFEIDPRSKKPVINDMTARTVLAWAYVGLLTNPVTGLVEDKILDTDDVYIDLIYDGGYPDDVKRSGGNLAKELRLDCIFITDNGDNINFNQAKVSSEELIWNSRYISRYEGYSTIFDIWTGKDINVSPVYHMSKIIPLVDREYELWYAPAGFNRATISDIKSLRWNPKLAERDQLYLMQLNPIVKFNVGYTVWGQLTTQKRPSALQDLNVMRLVLYIKRALEQFLKFFIFEFNDAETHNQIRAGIVPYLENIKKKRGLQDYSIEVGATDYEYKQKICHVNVVLQPTKVIERIELSLYVK